MLQSALCFSARTHLKCLCMAEDQQIFFLQRWLAFYSSGPWTLINQTLYETLLYSYFFCNLLRYRFQKDQFIITLNLFCFHSIIIIDVLTGILSLKRYFCFSIKIIRLLSDTWVRERERNSTPFQFLSTSTSQHLSHLFFFHLSFLFSLFKIEYKNNPIQLCVYLIFAISVYVLKILECLDCINVLSTLLGDPFWTRLDQVLHKSHSLKEIVEKSKHE